MGSILFLLFLISAAMTAISPRYSMFVFPDSVEVSPVQAFLGWYGWINLFVSLPFLWDGDFDNGMYPFILGLLPLAVSFYLVLKENDCPSKEFITDARIYLTEDKLLNTPAVNDYGFLYNYKKRIGQLGPKLFFKEIFAREKAFPKLAESLLSEDVKTVENKFRTLPWVIDGAVDIRAQLIFTIKYMMRENYLEKISENLPKFIENTAILAKNLKMGIENIPYPVAKFLAGCNALEVTQNNKALLRYVIEQDDFVCDDDEYVITVISGKLITENLLKWNFLVKLAGYLSLNLSQEPYTLIITNKQIIQISSGKSFKRSGFDMSLALNDRFLCFDGKNVIHFTKVQAAFYMKILQILCQNVTEK
ncbi:MAG: hypothetical protein ACI4ND_06375 [Succinivibrio sp.]